MYTSSELDQKVQMLRSLKRQAEEIDSKMEAIKEDLKAEMSVRGEYELSGDDWKVTWNMVSSNRFSQSEFKSAHPDLFKEYLRESSSRRFIIE